MLTQLIKSLVSVIVRLLGYIFSAKFLNTALLVFLFLVSIGAAEEKYIKTGKGTTTRNKKKASRGAHSPTSMINSLSPMSSEEKSNEEKSTKLLGNYRGKTIIIILLLFGLVYYKYPNKKSEVHVDRTTDTSFLDDMEWFIQACGLKIYQFYQCIVHVITTVIQILNQLDLHYYYTSYMAFYNRMPVIAITMLSIISIVSLTIILFGVYAFYSSSENVGLDHEPSSLHQRKSVKEIKQKRGSTIVSSLAEEDISSKPFLSLHQLCKTQTSQYLYNSFVDSFIHNHNISKQTANQLQQSIYVGSPLRTTQNVLYYPTSYEYPSSPQIPSFPETPSIQPSQDDQVLSETAITPLPTIASTTEEKEREPEKEPTPDTKDTIHPLLMEGIDPTIFAEIMKDVNSLVTNQTTTEATNTLKQAAMTPV